MERERNQRNITELLTFIHSNNVNIADIIETKLTYVTKPLKTPGLAAVRLDRLNKKRWKNSFCKKILTHIPFHDAQHALRPKHLTCTALSTITDDIAAGL